ncbi:hypothetical protein ABVF33_00110 [Candidatus Rickettsia barbariae]
MVGGTYILLTTLPLVGGGCRGLKPPTLEPTEGPPIGVISGVVILCISFEGL